MANADIYNLTNTNIAADAGIRATKLEGEFNFTHSQTSTIAAATQYLRVIRGGEGTIVAIEAAITEAIATGADRTVTIDLQKSTGGGAFATVLSSTIQFTNASTLRAVSAGTISTSGVVDGDILKVTVAVAGAAGAQATGLVVSVTLREDSEP